MYMTSGSEARLAAAVFAIMMFAMAETWKCTSFAEIPVDHLNPLLDRQFVHGEKGMLARLLLRKGCIVPRHSHENEQITYVLEGALKFVLGEGEAVVVGAGGLLVIPPNLPHSAEALEDTIDIDVFTPPRADWIDGSDAYLRR
jgi:quercetin dioxygenase-like cupin family protein